MSSAGAAVRPSETGDGARALTSRSLATDVALPLLIIVVYTDVSDLLMRTLGVPSVLQPLIVLVAAAVWWSRRTLRPGEVLLQPAVLAFATYGLLVFSTSIWAPDPRLVDGGFSEILKAIVICVLIASLTVSRPALERSFGALALSAAVFSTISVLQLATGGFEGALGGLVAPQSGTIYEHVMVPRAAGPPNSDPNFYARILLMVIPTAVALSVASATVARRAFFAAVALLITAATLLTYSRGAMITVAALALFLLVALRVPARSVALLGVATLAGALLLPGDLGRRVLTIETLMPNYDTTFSYDSSVEKRKLLVKASLAMFEAHPWTGVGAGHYGRSFTAFANEVGSSWIDYHPPGTIEHPHGLFFEIAAETGVPGLITFAATLAAIFVSLARSRRAFVARGERELAMIALTVVASICAYLMASVVLHETHFRYLALYLGFALALSRLARSRVHA